MSQVESGAAANPLSQRIVSVDALRGFDMFWIIGAEGIVHGLRAASNAPWAKFLSDQLEHVEWEGFVFYDLIFPLFIFIMGVSSVFSLKRIVEREGRQAATLRVLNRGILLYLIGVFYYGACSHDGGPEMFRWVGVLQRIGICYLCGGLLYLYLRLPGLIMTCIGLLLGYWALMVWVPVPGIETTSFAPGENLANYVDQQFLPGYKWDGDWDPEGLLSTLPAVASALLGIFAGLVISQNRMSAYQRCGTLAVLGIACLAIGWAWSIPFPIIKKLWTSSFVLWAGGWSFLLLSIFYLVIDIWNFKAWTQPFVWLGMNSITIYMIDDLVSFRDVALRVLHEPIQASIAPYGPLVVSVVALGLALWVCRYLYRRQIFLRV